jgi:hypothetical protein
MLGFLNLGCSKGVLSNVAANFFVWGPKGTLAFCSMRARWPPSRVLNWGSTFSMRDWGDHVVGLVGTAGAQAQKVPHE